MMSDTFRLETMMTIKKMPKHGKVLPLDLTKPLYRKYFPAATRIADALESIEIVVKKADVKGSVPKDPCKCAASRATRRRFGADTVGIFLSVSYLQFGDLLIRFATPATVAREITSHDRNVGGIFAEGPYRLSKISKSSRLRTCHRLTRGVNDGSKGKRNFAASTVIPNHRTVGVREAA